MLRCLAIVLAAATVGCAHTQGPADEERPVIESVRLEGVSALNEGAIKAGLVTRATGPWPWSTRHRLDRLALEQDLRRIETFYRLNGYYDAEVASTRVEVRNGAARVVIAISEGDPTRIERVEVLGLEALAPDLRRRVEERLPLRPGRVLLASDYDTALELLRQRLREAGYARAEVEGRVDIFPNRREAFVTVAAKPGPVVHFGDLVIDGLRIIPAKKVRDAARRAVPEGRLFSPQALEDAQAFVYDLGVFETVRAVLADPEEALPPGTVRVIAQERAANALTLGGGVGIERGLQQLELVANLRNINLVGGASRLSWENTLGLQLLPTLFRPERVGFSAESALELTVPQVWRSTDLAGRVAFERVFQQAYAANAFSVQLGTPFRPRRFAVFGPAIGFQQYARFDPVPLAGPAPPNLSTDCPAPCRLAGPEIEATCDRRDDPISPRRGYLLLGEAQYAVPVFGGFHFLRIEPEVRGYVPIGRIVLAGRLSVRAVWPLGSTEFVPIVGRLFGGGEGGHRAFGPDRLSPMLQSENGDFVPAGGTGAWLASIEARWRFLESWGLAVFIDYGNVTERPLQFGPDAPLGLGVGVRYYTLAGPVRLDVAWRVDQRARRAVNTGALVETSPIDFFALSLSLGEAF
ncbi:MAG: BamA/OMP85 family outer membrane protein [Myxococcales bacterium]